MMFVEDLRHAWRAMRRAPVFFTGAILVLALGVGANGTVFSIMRAVLLQPLPYRDPGNVVMVWRAPVHPVVMAASSVPNESRGILTPEMLLGWRSEAHDVLADVAAVDSWNGNLDAQFDLPVAGSAERLRGALVTPNFFELLGVRAERGRTFASSDESSAAPLIVISHALWQRAFGADPSIVGRQITLIAGQANRGPRPFVVAGVLPPAFRFSYPDETEVWALTTWHDVEQLPKRALIFQAVARLKPGVTLEAAQARAAAIQTGLFNQSQPRDRAEGVKLERVGDWVVGETRPQLLLLGGVALLLLLITCATIASALLVRVAARRRELAVRASLGASPGRLLRQLLTEGLALSVAGTVAGTALALALSPALRALVPATVPRADEIGVNGWILAFAAVTAGATTILAALAPAWTGTRFDMISTIKSVSTQSSADRATARWRQGLVGFQAAVATALLIASVLLLTSLWHLGRVPLGFDGRKVLTVEMRLLDPKYRQPGALENFESELMTRVRTLPGILEAGVTSAVPFRGTDFYYMLGRPGDAHPHGANARFVDSAFFSVMRMELTRGRVFTSRDTHETPKVVVLSESYARQLFGAEDPLGQSVQGEGPLQVVGIVRDVRYKGLDRDAAPAIYFASAQVPSGLVCIVARTAANAGNVGTAIRRAVAEIDPTLPAMKLTTIDQIVSQSVAGRRFYTTATSAFAIVALILTVMGLAVIVSRSVIERRKELAIRGALGATPSRLVALVLGQGLSPLVIGTGAGVVIALAAARLMDRFLFQVQARDPMVFAGVALLIVVAAAASALVPARTVTGIPPAAVLRSE